MNQAARDSGDSDAQGRPNLMAQQPSDRSVRGWGIGHALVLLVLVTLAPFIVLEAYRGVQDVARLRAAVADQGRTQAREKATAVDDFLRLTERFLATLAAAPSVQALDASGAAGLFQAARGQNPNYENVFLVTTDGMQRASTAPEIDDVQVTERPYFRQALVSGRMAISEVLTWPGTGRSAVVLAYPVASPDGNPIGVVAVALNIARLSSVIGVTSLPDGSVVLLAQADGAVIAADDRAEFWVGQSLAGQQAFESGRLRIDGPAPETMADGVQRVTGAHPLARAPWLMLVGVPQAEVNAAQQRAVARLGQQLALVALVTSALAFVVLRRVVAPIRALSEGARAFAAGYLHQRIPLRRDDELGDLADALNRMAAALERRLEEEAAHARALRKLTQLQSEFVATASHELRTPVTAIRSYAEALMRPDITDEATRRECLEGIDRGSERLARLVQTLLDVSRIDSGQVAVSLAPVDATAIVRLVAAQLNPAGSEQISVIAPPDLPLVQADPDRLEDVLANLTGNARKFSPPGAPVSIILKRTEDEVVIAVHDHGDGIATEEIERIFDRFYQVQRGADRRVGGAGLGLYIAHGYTTAMGGRIWVESAPGQGSAFFVAMAIASAHAEKPAREDGDATIAGSARRR